MKKLTILFCFLYLFHVGHGQIVDFDKYVPPTPEAAHLQKQVNVPVDYSTGIPNISVPLFLLVSGNIEVPISLNYHASGIRVGQLSSSVGLGWGLNAGGGIARTIRGKSDDGGWLSNNYTNYFAQTTMNGTQGANDYMLDNYDFTQDDYSFNFSGFGGNFFFDSTKTIRNVEKGPIKLEYINPGTNTKFKATDVSGFTYYFDSTDYSSSVSFPSNNTSNTALSGGITAWKLTKIKFQEVDSIKLDYQKYTVQYDENGADVWDLNQGFIDCVPAAPGCQTCGDDYQTALYYMITSRYFENSLVKQITSKDAQVNFYYSDDASATVWKRKLDSITVKSLVDNVVKKRIYLVYSRFSNGQLQLKAVRNLDVNTGEFEETKFVYYSNDVIGLPSIGSRSKDLFGFFNNKTNQKLIVTNDPAYTTVFANADRSVNESVIMLGTLRSITYPTGGYTEYVYEPNKVNATTYGPGIRLKESRQYNAVDGKLNRTAYEYYGYHGQSVTYPYYMLPDVQEATYRRRYFSSDEPNNYRVPMGVEPQGYVYDSVVVKSKLPTGDLLTTRNFNYYVIYNGYKALPHANRYYRYDSGSGTYSLIKKESSEFTNSIDYTHQTPLLGVERPWLMLVASFSDANVTCKTVTAGFFTQYSYVENGVIKLKDIETTYSSGDSAVIETRYYYANSNHLQPTKITRLNSVDSTITNIKYPHEMVSGSLDPTGIYQTMVNSHFWGPEIIRETTRPNGTALTKSATTYKQWTGMIGPELLQSSTNGSALETRKKINQYGQFGNLAEYEVDGMKDALVWDYLGSSVVAKVVNSASTESAYTSFETAAMGGWSVSGGSYNTSYYFTGKRSYTLTTGQSISKSGLTAQAYVISYWLKSGSVLVNGGTGTAILNKNGWTLYEHNLASATSISITGSSAILDELRLFPKSAQMNTITYNHLVGTSAAADASGKTGFYDYDGLGRLTAIRNIDNNIIRKVSYATTQTGNGTLYYNTETMQTFQKEGCTSGYEGSFVAYTVPAGRYSSKISQADADAQAALELANLGQLNANYYGACVVNPTCNSGNCPGPAKHCVNDVCTRGLKVYSSSTYNSSTGYYDCYYHYEWSDGFRSADFYEQSSVSCL